MCAYLVQITLVKCNTRPSNNVNYFKMYYVVVSMLRGLLKDFLVNYNHNTMVEIDQYLSSVLNYNISVHLPKIDISSIKSSRQRHAVFHYFSLTIAERMLPILLHTTSVWFHRSKRKIIDNIIDYNLGETDGCAKQYRCTSKLYLVSVMSQCYSIIIDWGIGAPGHDREVVDRINDVDKHYIYTKIDVHC